MNSVINSNYYNIFNRILFLIYYIVYYKAKPMIGNKMSKEQYKQQ
jgi:hypothetical protein